MVWLVSCAVWWSAARAMVQTQEAEKQPNLLIPIPSRQTDTRRFIQGESAGVVHQRLKGVKVSSMAAEMTSVFYGCDPELF